MYWVLFVGIMILWVTWVSFIVNLVTKALANIERDLIIMYKSGGKCGYYWIWVSDKDGKDLRDWDIL